MSAQIRRYIAENQDFHFQRGLNEKEQKASNLRQQFVKKFIINNQTDLFTTQEERDWAYVAKREYNYDVVLTGLGYSTMIYLTAFAWRVFVNKRMVYWPVVLIPISYYLIQPVLLQKHSKKLFDMCNLGEDFYLGRKRNELLKLCNEILGVEDF